MHDAAEILTINGGSSSLKFALFAPANPGEKPERRAGGNIENIGTPQARMKITEAGGSTEEKQIDAGHHGNAADAVIAWLRGRPAGGNAGAPIAAIGHRVVHGGLRLARHAVIDDALVMELRRARPLDLAHLPREIALIETFAKEFPGVPQVACFDSAFHQDMPAVAKRMPIPRRFTEAGVRRLGFHGLSYAYLLQELERVAGKKAAQGKIILAHLGSGASMAAVNAGKPLDTTMGFTPTAGLVMGTRPGDMDPGLLVYLMRAENMSAKEADEFINEKCGILGIAETAFDMRTLAARRNTDPRAAEAIASFCYSARKWIGALAAVLGGVETLVFSAGIGEHAADVRQEICTGLQFLGANLDPGRNLKNASIISTDDSPLCIRVIPTDEEIMMAKIVTDLAIHK